MDPLTQTIFTLFCMLGAYIWGRKTGLTNGSVITWTIVLNSFKAAYIELDEDKKEIIFTDSWGTIRSSSTFWDSNGNTDKEQIVSEKT